MSDLTQASARICFTAAGVLIHENKVLLVKHKKVGWWLAPGGHLDENELPHQGAEREFWEETGIKVKAVRLLDSDPTWESEYLPNPIVSNLHWISQENYQARLASADPTQPHPSPMFPRGCEQHVCFLYLVEPTGSLDYQMNAEESDGIQWFSEVEVDQLDTTADIKYELHLAFRLWNQRQKA